jgi:RNA polymerase sigma-70 factor (ECF subfamily)
VRYLTRRWPVRDEIHDLRQETYLRVYEAKERPRSAKAFLFTTARHLLVDRMRRQRVVSFEPGWDLDGLNVLIDEISPERCAGADEELRALAVAFNHLPPRCKQVVWMRRVEDQSQKEVAARLGIGRRWWRSTSRRPCDGSPTHYLVATVKGRKVRPRGRSGKTTMYDSIQIEALICSDRVHLL